MSDIFAEVDEDLRADRAQKMLKKYGGVLIGAALVVVIGVAGWQAWRAYEAKETARVAGIFLDASRSAGVKAPAERDLALAEFAKIANEGSAG
ncbi:MAG: tetratricopeptide repeat protein, partial [Alphaproteobacteria bacterium]|nr:tetratricopeptide repeat protein [Alphaproteobacteria bacterium]